MAPARPGKAALLSALLAIDVRTRRERIRRQLIFDGTRRAPWDPTEQPRVNYSVAVITDIYDLVDYRTIRIRRVREALLHELVQAVGGCLPSTTRHVRAEYLKTCAAALTCRLRGKSTDITPALNIDQNTTEQKKYCARFW